MIKRILLLSILAVSFFNQLHSADIGLEGGASYFNYAEVGINNKDDLYTIKSSLVGLTFRISLSEMYLKTSLRTQVPFDLIFTDALGTDESDYLETLLFFGGNFQLSLLYPLFENNIFDLYIGPLVNYDYFYFKDFVVGMDDKYYFSVLGAGACIEFLYHLNKSLSLNITSSWNFNFLEIGDRVGTINWSNNLLVSSGVVYKF